MENNAKKARLLIVEDNLANQTLLRYYLGDAFDLELAGRFDDALRAATQRRFDLFLLDIDLGEQRTGVDLLRELRKMPAYTATPAVTCTANTRPGDRERFLALGFDAYIGKPFTEEELLDTLHTVLASSCLSRSTTTGEAGCRRLLSPPVSSLKVLRAPTIHGLLWKPS